MGVMEDNKVQWTELFDEYEDKMKAGNTYFEEVIELKKLPGHTQQSAIKKQKTLKS